MTNKHPRRFRGRLIAIAVVASIVLVIGSAAVYTLASVRFAINYSMSSCNIIVLTHGLNAYANQNDNTYPVQDQWPDALLSEEIIYPEMLVSPIEDGDGISYIYVPGPFTEDPNQILIYEDPKHWPEKGVLVGFSDTTVRFVPFDEFDQMLEKQLAETQP